MRHAYLPGLMMLAIGVVVLGFSLSAPNTPVQAAGGATVMIPEDNYSPVAIVIEAGQSVTWINKDSDKHAAMSVSGVPEPFSITISAGTAASHKFTKPGVYPYYDWTHATFDPKLRRAVARKGTDTYPIAMEGLNARPQRLPRGLPRTLRVTDEDLTGTSYQRVEDRVPIPGVNVSGKLRCARCSCGPAGERMRSRGVWPPC